MMTKSYTVPTVLVNARVSDRDTMCLADVRCLQSVVCLTTDPHLVLLNNAGSGGLKCESRNAFHILQLTPLT